VTPPPGGLLVVHLAGLKLAVLDLGRLEKLRHDDHNVLLSADLAVADDLILCV
jgi:hypothetical protein